jgi:glyoxylase-like metal-dependent hydrolase (beta-lactamase superfamily II)
MKAWTSGFPAALLVLSLMPRSASADSAATLERSVTEVGPGIFAIRHADGSDTNPQGNTTVIIGDAAVLVVDSAYLPSSAREDIAQIRKWTSKPVRYLLNTHWHPDHQRGNQSYVEAWPDISIIAQRETPRLMTLYETGNLERYPKRVAALRASLDNGKDAQGKHLSAAARKQMEETYAAQKKVVDELKSHRLQLPTVTFDSEMDVDLGGRVVQIRHHGRGDTLGDAWAYLPREKVLVTGDVVTAPVPYFFAGYPADLANVLRYLTTLDVQTIVPGHGNPMHDWSYVRAELEMLDTIIAQVGAEIARRGSLSAKLEDVAKAIDTRAYRERFAGSDPMSQEYFDESIEGLIKDAFYQAPK